MHVILQNHSSYPVDDELRRSSHAPQALVDAVIRDQEQAGVDVVTDGQVHCTDPIAHVLRGFDGVDVRVERSRADSSHAICRPVVRAELRRRAPILRDDFSVARQRSRLPVKPILPGPYTVARMCVIESGPYRDVPALAHAFSTVLALEVEDLVTAGAQFIQIDEPAILSHAADLRLLREVLEPLWAARGSARIVLATYGNDVEPLYAQLNSVPADIIALDCTRSPKLADLIAATGASKVLALGLVDGYNPQLESAADIARHVDRLLKRYTLDSVHLLPSCGLGQLSCDQARAKLALLAHIRQMIRPLA